MWVPDYRNSTAHALEIGLNFGNFLWIRIISYMEIRTYFYLLCNYSQTLLKSPPKTNNTLSFPTVQLFAVAVYRVSQEEQTKLREGVPYVKLYRYNPKHLYPKLNGYGDNGKRSLKL